MTERIAEWLVKIFGAAAAGVMGKYLVVFFISMLPILELRGGLIAASLLDLPMWQSYLVCFIGNIIPIPFILWLIVWILGQMKKIKAFQKIVLWVENKADSKKDSIERLGYIGLFFFVAIPLPGTGAWTGCLIAALLGMDKRKSALTAVLGVIVAGIIMLIFSYGVLGFIFK